MSKAKTNTNANKGNAKVSADDALLAEVIDKAKSADSLADIARMLGVDAKTMRERVRRTIGKVSKVESARAFIADNAEAIVRRHFDAKRVRDAKASK